MLRDDRMAARPGYCMRSNMSRPRNTIQCNVSRGKIDTCSTWSRAERRARWALHAAKRYHKSGSQSAPILGKDLPAPVGQIGRRRPLIDMICHCYLQNMSGFATEV